MSCYEIRYFDLLLRLLFISFLFGLDLFHWEMCDERASSGRFHDLCLNTWQLWCLGFRVLGLSLYVGGGKGKGNGTGRKLKVNNMNQP